MGKMFNALVLSGLISIVLLVFDGAGVLGVIGQFFLSPPSDWGNFLLSAMLSELGIATSIGGAVVIGAIVIKQDWLMRMGFFTLLATWVNAPFIALWNFLASKTFPLESCTSAYTCATLIDGSGFTTLGMILASVVVGPMILYALWACWSQIWSPESSG